jgi:hypothetical protein
MVRLLATHIPTVWAFGSPRARCVCARVGGRLFVGFDLDRAESVSKGLSQGSCSAAGGLTFLFNVDRPTLFCSSVYIPRNEKADSFFLVFSRGFHTTNECSQAFITVLFFFQLFKKLLQIFTVEKLAS